MNGCALFFIIMKKNFFILLLGVLTISTTTNAQSKKGRFLNLDVGVSVGSMTEKLQRELTITFNDGTKKDEKVGYDLDYTTITYSAALEYQLEGFITMFEGSYTRGSGMELDDYTDEKFLKIKLDDFDKSVNLFTGNAFLGGVINRQKRFQVPILGGVGLTYVGGAPINKLHFDFVYKIRAKYYVSDNIAIYGGVSGSYGLSSKDNEFEGEASKIDLACKRLHFELGVSISLKRLNGGKK